MSAETSSKDKRPLRVAIWCAVSSKSQAGPDKVSMADQERQGREFARAIGGGVKVYKVPGHTRDVIFWSDAEREMPAYRELREGVAQRAFDVLHVVDVDRLGRDPALCEQVVSLVEKNGAEVYLASAPHQIGQKTVGIRYVSAIQSMRAGEMQAIRVRRHRAGIRGRISRGLVASHWPTGYRPIRDARGRTVGAEFDESIGAGSLSAANTARRF